MWECMMGMDNDPLEIEIHQTTFHQIKSHETNHNQRNLFQLFVLWIIKSCLSCHIHFHLFNIENTNMQNFIKSCLSCHIYFHLYNIENTNMQKFILRWRYPGPKPKCSFSSSISLHVFAGPSPERAKHKKALWAPFDLAIELAGRQCWLKSRFRPPAAAVIVVLPKLPLVVQVTILSWLILAQGGVSKTRQFGNKRQNAEFWTKKANEQ